MAMEAVSTVRGKGVASDSSGGRPRKVLITGVSMLLPPMPKKAETKPVTAPMIKAMNFIALIIGAVTGFVSAFFGIGGSSIDTPVIRTFLGLPPLESLATPLPLTVLTASIAMFAYRKARLADYRITGLSLITAVPGVVLGSLLTAYISGKFLMLLTAVVLALVGIDFIVKDLTEKTLVINKPGKR